MNSETKSGSKLFKIFSILAVTLALAVSGIYLWQNEFDLSFFSSANSNKISYVVTLGDSVADTEQYWGTELESQLKSEFGSSIKYIDGVSSKVTLPLKDQTVAAYQTLPRDIKGKVAFVVVTGQNTIQEGLSKKDSPQLISKKIENNITSMLQLMSDRPGIFPNGFVVYLTEIYDPTDGILASTSCLSKYSYENKSQITTLNAELIAMNQRLQNNFSKNIVIVPFSKAFVGHGAGATSENLRWVSNCSNLNTKGNEELSHLIMEKIRNVK